jgi:hypothetical protein
MEHLSWEVMARTDTCDHYPLDLFALDKSGIPCSEMSVLWVL